MGSTPIFSPTSQFAQDFQSVIDRQVALASLPMQQLQNVKNHLSDESTSLGGLDGKFAALQTALQNLDTAVATPAASVSDPSIVSATAASDAADQSYTIEVVSLGAYTTTMSKNGLTTVSDPSTQNISNAASFTLTVDGTPYTVTPASQTLDSLVQAINAIPGANVQASIVNVGPPSAPDYRLSLQGTNLAPDTIQLNDGTNDLLDSLATGANASYKVDGMPTAIQSTSRTVTLAPGLTVQMLQQSTPGVATTVTVSSNSAGISKAISAFTDAYNAAVDAVNQEHGANPGALNGENIVDSLSNVLSSIVTYQGGSGSFGSVRDLGLTMDSQGHLSFDAGAFATAMNNNSGAVISFLGNSTSGFLQVADSGLSSLEDPTSGLIKTTLTDIQQQMSAQDDLIAGEQSRIDQLQQQLQQQMSAADALVASLQQQASYMTNLFQSMFNNSQGSK